MKQCEHCCIRTDSESQRQYCDRSEAWRFDKRSKRIDDIAPEIFNEREPTQIPHLFLNTDGIAEIDRIVVFAGEIAMKGMEGYAVPVVLRRQHAMDGTMPSEDADAADIAKPAATTAGAQPRGRKRAKKR